MTDTHNTIQRPDLKGRINLGEIANNVRSYRVTVASDGKWKMENGKWKMENGKWKIENGKVTLEPYAEIPLSEKWIFQDKELLEKIISQSKLKREQTE